jgi:hypothetical protein
MNQTNQKKEDTEECCGLGLGTCGGTKFEVFDKTMKKAM